MITIPRSITNFAYTADEMEHFFNGTTGTKFGIISLASGGTVVAQVVDGVTGVIRSQTGTAASANQRAGFGAGTSGIHLGRGIVTSAWRILLSGVLFDGTLTGVYRFGLIDSLTSEATDACCFRMTDAGNMFAVTRNNGVETATNLGFRPTLNAWDVYKIEVNYAGTSCVFMYNGAVVATHTTNIPTGSGRHTGLGAWIIRVAATGTNAILDCDWTYLRIDHQTPPVLS